MSIIFSGKIWNEGEYLFNRYFFCLDKSKVIDTKKIKIENKKITQLDVENSNAIRKIQFLDNKKILIWFVNNKIGHPYVISDE